MRSKMALNSRYQLWLLTLFFTHFVHPALADDGDDFINNLLTDIAPILALFGERVTTQFLSQSFSILDCIIFAACPIGIVTATVSAIRVAAPNSWRSLIGRAMESRAATELELLSSTSPDVCELWSGSALVRVMGSPGILELLYFPELDTPDNVHCGLFTLNEKTENRPQIESQWLSMEGKKLRRQSPFEGKGTQPGPPDNEAMKPSDRDRQASPSISMNLSSFYNGSRLELRLMTIFGVLVQLCVVGYSAMITYYGPWSRHFTKDGGPVLPAAFPLMTTGTIMVSVGMFICALVIEKCTTETEWKENCDPIADTNIDATANQPAPKEPNDPKKKQFRLLWLQKHKIVNDQAFKSCAILAGGSRTRLLTSDIQEAVSAPLELGSMVGVLVSLVGFVLQFSGLRLMNWSATLAQLIGMAIMTVMRAYLRIGFVDRPKTLRVVHDRELDWFASQFVIESEKLWEAEGEKVDEAEPKPPGFLWLLRRDEKLFEKEPEEQDDDKEPRVKEEEQQSEEGEQQQPTAIRLWRVRQRLGFLSPWTSDYVDISKAVSLAVESVMGILLANTEARLVEESFRWSLKGIWSDREEVPLAIARGNKEIPFAIPLGNEKQHPWGSPGEIEAALSIWSSFLVDFPADRKVVRSPKDCRRSRRQDITLWAGQKETGLILFDLLDEGQAVPHKQLSSSTRPLGTLLAQRIFLWFMLDLAENLSSRLPKTPTVTFLDNRNPAFKGVHLEHPTLTAMVQKIQQSGLASTEEAWDMVILPLSFHQKLPSPMTIVEEMRNRSRNLEQTGQWTQVLKIQEQMVEMCKGMKHEVKTYERAAAIIIDTYRRIGSILEMQTQQLRRQQHLIQLHQVERKMKKMIFEDLDARIVRSLLRFYNPQKSGLALREEVGRRTAPKDHFGLGRLEMKFTKLIQEPGRGEEEDGFQDVLETIRRLPQGIRDWEENRVRWYHVYRFWKRKSREFPDPLGLTLAHHVIFGGMTSVGRTLDIVAPKSDSVASVSDIAGWTPLHYAFMASEVRETIMALWRYGGSVHAQSRDGTTPLHCLARTGHRDEVTHLLELGAMPMVYDNGGYTPLHWAAWCGNVEAIEALLSKGADTGSHDNYGRTPLHLATIAWKENAVALLSCKSDIGAKDVDMNTALHYAAMLGNCTFASRRDWAEEESAQQEPIREEAAEEAGQQDNDTAAGESPDAVADHRVQS